MFGKVELLLELMPQIVKGPFLSLQCPLYCHLLVGVGCYAEKAVTPAISLIGGSGCYADKLFFHPLLEQLPNLPFYLDSVLSHGHGLNLSISGPSTDIPGSRIRLVFVG